MKTITRLMNEGFIFINHLLSALTGEQIALISIFISFIIYILGKQNELRMRKHETKKEQYIKFIKVTEKIFQHSKSGTKKSSQKLQSDIDNEFFDLGSSLLMYGSKKLYKQYLFYREYSSNPLIEQSKFYNTEHTLYLLSAIFKTMRKEVGLNLLNTISDVEILGFFINNMASNPIFKIKSYRSRYCILMIKLELWLYDRYLLVGIKNGYYALIAPFIGVISVLYKFLILLPLGKLILKINPNAMNDITETQKRVATIINESRDTD